MNRIWIAVLLGALVTTADADPVSTGSFTIDFESLAPVPYPGGIGNPLMFTDLRPLTMDPNTSGTGLTVLLYRLGPDSGFDIVQTGGMLPTQFESQSLAAFGNPDPDSRFYITFGGTDAGYLPGAFTIDLGDFIGSDIDDIDVNSYDTLGNVMQSGSTRCSKRR